MSAIGIGLGISSFAITPKAQLPDFVSTALGAYSSNASKE
jgi:hypothetical protein